MDKKAELATESTHHEAGQVELMTIEAHEAMVTAAHHQASQSTSQFDKEKEDFEISFAKMQQEVAQVLASLVSDENMAKVKSEYEKMNRALFRSKENMEKYYNHYSTLEKEYQSNLDVGHEAYKVTFNDATHIRQLKSNIAKLQEQMEGNASREEAGKEELRLLRMEISSLLMTLKQGVGLSVVQERTLMELNQTKDQMTRELEQEMDKIVQFRNRITDVSEKIKQSEDQRRLCETDIFELKEKSASKKSDIDQEMRNKERLEHELRELRVVVGNKTNEVRAKQDAVNRAADDINLLESQFKTQKQILERLVKDHESLSIRAVKLKQECGDQINGAIHLREQNEAMEMEVKLKENDLLRCKAEVKKINKIREGLVKKNRATDEIKCDLEAKRRKIKETIDQYVAEEARVKRQNEVHKKMIDDLSRERDIIFANEQKEWNETQRSFNLSAPYRQIKENLEFEIGRFKRELEDHEHTIKRITLEKDLYIREAANLQAQCVECLNKIKEQENTIYEYKKQMVGTDTKLKHQQALYEAVQSDRNLHAKHLVEALSEISEMKRKLRIMNYQINGYKDDIKIKQDYLTKASSEGTRLKKDIEMIGDEIKTLKNQNELAQAYIRTQLAEELRLNQFVKESEMERSRQQNSLQVLHNERDNLSDQLIKQNDELSKVYEKIKSQHTQLHTSQKLYQQRLSQISTIRKKIAEARQLKEKLKEETDHIGDLKHMECRLSNEVVFEKTRVKALEEQVKNPVNIHRWRKLEGSNPKSLEMIQMMHALQKKIKAKVDQDEDLAKQLSMHQELYLQCKALISKQIGPEALEQLSEYEKIYKDKHNQLRHLDSELHMYQAQTREYKHSLTTLDQELGELKTKYVQEWFRQYQQYNPSMAQRKMSFKSTLSHVKHEPLPPLPKLDETSPRLSIQPSQPTTAPDTRPSMETSMPSSAPEPAPESPITTLEQDSVIPVVSQPTTPSQIQDTPKQVSESSVQAEVPQDTASRLSSASDPKKPRPKSTLAQFLPLEAMPAGYQIPDDEEEQVLVTEQASAVVEPLKESPPPFIEQSTVTVAADSTLLSQDNTTDPIQSTPKQAEQEQETVTQAPSEQEAVTQASVDSNNVMPESTQQEAITQQDTQESTPEKAPKKGLFDSSAESSKPSTSES